MARATLCILFAALAVLPCAGQATPSDSQTLQAILSELRAMHNDVRLSQASQLLLAELQIEQGSVTREMERRDSLRAALTQVQEERKKATADLSQDQAALDGSFGDTMDPVRKKQWTAQQDDDQQRLEALKPREQQASSDLAEAESQLRAEQARLDSIQAQLNEIVAKLQPDSSR